MTSIAATINYESTCAVQFKKENGDWDVTKSYKRNQQEHQELPQGCSPSV